MIINTKICSKCLQELTFNLFSKGNGRNSLKNYCKDCDSIASRENYLSKREQKIKDSKRWNDENGIKVSSYQRKYRDKISKTNQRFRKRSF